MTPDTAIALIDGLVYKPGWSFETTDHCHRYENSVLVRINYPAQRSERAEAADGYATTITTYAKFIILLDKLDDVGLYRRLLDHIACIDSHEAREFLRTRPTLWRRSTRTRRTAWSAGATSPPTWCSGWRDGGNRETE
jgi:hypothetical protein